MMKQSNWLLIFFILNNLASYSQDSMLVVHPDHLKKYREGYIITNRNDTIPGLIYHESDTGIYFINASKKIKTTTFGKQSTIPHIPSDYPIVKAFLRNGIFYENCKIPPGNHSVYLAVIEDGPVKLYGKIANYSGKQFTEDMFIVGFLPVTFFGILSESDSTKKNSQEEYYSVTAYYLQKMPDPELILLPKGEKKFRDVFIPLIRDNPAFVKLLPGQAIDLYHVHDLVKRYNLTYKH
jgi:hypothetical protein